MAEDKRKTFDPWLIPPDPPSQPAPAAVPGPMTVSQVTACIRQAITRSLPPTVYVIGQISNLKRHTSGHLYLTLKDAHSELPCVMWRTEAARLKFQPADGLEVVATGGIEVFDRAGKYQLYIRKLEPRGVGSLELAFRQLYERLKAEGLFDAAHKKSPPRYSRRIAIVTSPTGAAIADILKTILHRFPCCALLVFPVRVQGPGAAAEIAAAVRLLNERQEQLGGIDVMIVARGGGSLEDLWAFNEEIVARALFVSRIPVISGVGHEVDTTMTDLVADVRAATPTAAAQAAVPVLAEVLYALDGWQLRLGRAIEVLRELATSKLGSLWMRGPLRDPLTLVRGRSQTLDVLVHRSHRGQLDRLGRLRANVDRLEQVVQRIAPHAVLSRMAGRLNFLDRTMRDGLLRNLAALQRKREVAARRLERASPSRVVPVLRQQVGQEGRRLDRATAGQFAAWTQRLQAGEGVLQAVSHQSVLERGYSITRLEATGAVIRSVADADEGSALITQLRDGQVRSRVES